MNTLREGLPPLPSRFVGLPIDKRGYPIPWFVATLDDGTRDFRMADGGKRVLAVRERRCWLCGDRLGRYLAFVIGPMCAVNRNTSEPPCHRECAEFAVQACPFMTRPGADYREARLPPDHRVQPHSLPGNPGATCIWITKRFRPYRVPNTAHDWLIEIGDPVEVQWWAEGKPATRAQIIESFERRLPILAEAAGREGPAATAALSEQVARAMMLIPVE